MNTNNYLATLLIRQEDNFCSSVASIIINVNQEIVERPTGDERLLILRDY